MEVLIRQTSVTQNVRLGDSVSEANNADHNNIDTFFCGPREYIIGPTFDWLSLSGNEITLQTDDTNDATDGSPHIIYVTASLENYPDIDPVTRSFEVTITD